MKLRSNGVGQLRTLRRNAIEASIDLRTAMNAMRRLPDEQREIVALILIEGLGYRECSEILGLPIGTVSSRLVRVCSSGLLSG